MTFPGFMAWIYFVLLGGPTEADSPPGFLALAVYALSKVVQFGFPLLWIWRFERHRLRLQRPHFGGLATGLAFGLAVSAVLLAPYFASLRGADFLSGTPENVRAKISTFHADTPAKYFLLALFVAGFHSLMEEYYWRWFVFGELKRSIPVVPAIVLSSLAFMIHHIIVLDIYFPGRLWSAAIPFSLCVAFGGAAWAWLYHRTGTIYSCWISHLLIDAAIMVVGYDMVFVYMPAN
jgi:membrane protease YdiL (CAAX protease family)